MRIRPVLLGTTWSVLTTLAVLVMFLAPGIVATVAFHVFDCAIRTPRQDLASFAGALAVFAGLAVPCALVGSLILTAVLPSHLEPEPLATHAALWGAAVGFVIGGVLVGCSIGSGDPVAILTGAVFASPWAVPGGIGGGLGVARGLRRDGEAGR